jgi:hypothetical protein
VAVHSIAGWDKARFGPPAHHPRATPDKHGGPAVAAATLSHPTELQNHATKYHNSGTLDGVCRLRTCFQPGRSRLAALVGGTKCGDWGGTTSFDAKRSCPTLNLK